MPFVESAFCSKTGMCNACVMHASFGIAESLETIGALSVAACGDPYIQPLIDTTITLC